MDTEQQISIPASLEEARIKALPTSAFYIANFISIAEENQLLEKIAAAPKPKWKQLSKRRLQTWPSDLTNNSLLDSPLPAWLIDPVVSRILSCPTDSANKDVNVFTDSPHHAPNHVLINEYLPGQGIMPHKDGSAYYPVVCTVSLGASLCLDLYGTESTDGTIQKEPKWKILQEPRSLLITTEELYTDYLHGIAEVTEDLYLTPETVSNWDLLRSPHEIQDGRSDRKTRTSLTYRDVMKVSKLGAKFAMFGKR